MPHIINTEYVSLACPTRGQIQLVIGCLCLLYIKTTNKHRRKLNEGEKREILRDCVQTWVKTTLGRYSFIVWITWPKWLKNYQKLILTVT